MNIEKTALENLRQEYSAQSLLETDINKNPFIQFDTWFNEALQSGIIEPNAMTISTSTVAGKPSARVVLLKGFDENGFTFFTNYQSRKGAEIEQNPNVCLSFFWIELQRQIIIEGTVQKVDKEESTRYFQSRPKGSQIGAWASAQSQAITNRSVLEQKWAELEKQYEHSDVLPKPDHWGGFLVNPNFFEFWQGRPSRLHDRLQYTKGTNNEWKIQRVAP
ncbi:pyridoxamine 5'-phosphate oxidase [Solitalea koreensis]|uniref:Pyridoxine/pyridoxamine 5'-phosphate oxidase n=1 Tax=Solitalea koreensis TaxID=543615 RepID=A0A521B8T6_9SPHI|nr:pyridoxamine 5'-phosphate oxidase [Solitalea koreensis]SMO43512.1 Pyridoxamine 5'-phosphate oxidase [Solitalea koreensis]